MLCQSTGPELAGKALEEKKIVQHLISSTEVGHGAWGKDGLAASAWVLNFLKLPPCALRNPSASAHLAGIAHLLLAETRCLHVLQCQALGVS